MSWTDYQPSYLKNLPHIQPPGATLFVTYRLAGSIPIIILEQLKAEAQRLEQELAKITNRPEQEKQAYLNWRQMFGKWDHALDTAVNGPYWLAQPEIAQLVADNLHYWDTRKYDLHSYCIMSNHVHTVFTPLPEIDDHYHSLASIMQSLKRHTATEANRHLGRSGQFWQHESFDHIVRDPAELERIVLYVLNNPVKANLVQQWQDWPWNYCQTLPRTTNC
jgi:putative transposase